MAALKKKLARIQMSRKNVFSVIEKPLELKVQQECQTGS
jgi:hypothetical protein